MLTSIILNRINSSNLSWNVIVLKGFSVSIYNDLIELNKYEMVESSGVFEGNRIALEKLNYGEIMSKLFSGVKKGIMLFESFQILLNNMKSLDAFPYNFLVLENNFLDRYENPSTSNISDFDDLENLDVSGDNNVYNNHYSYCKRKDNRTYVEYIDILSDYPKNKLYILKLVDQTNIKVENSNISANLELSPNNESIFLLKEEIFETLMVRYSYYSIDKSLLDQPCFRNQLETLYSFCLLLDVKINFLTTDNRVENIIRSELFFYLKKYWGYDSFRSLKFYKDVSQGRELINISQGEIIENVIVQVENAMKRGKSMRNILLTAPTGSGKSLLFQLAGIYIAEKYKALTIVVSPLIALMKDQVYSLKSKHRYDKAVALTSELSIDEKQKAYEDVQCGEIDILYISPELLISSSISNFIGTRRIGLFVVDEAHTVTTWGKDFRIDYWFLGKHIQKIKKILDYQFPIFAVTATAVWDPSGENDMIFETLKYLYMDPCVKYVGMVRRENISFDISVPKLNKKYKTQKLLIVNKRIDQMILNGNKTIIYFPFKKTIDELYASLSNEKLPLISCYHSGIGVEEKKEYAGKFRDGISNIILATKAFGMGIDVSNIDTVYHFAPSGYLSDYVQEIGRLAREENINGVAKIDYFKEDLRYTKVLHSLSEIKPYQMKLVLRKLMQLFDKKQRKRNMLISSSDFEFIFPSKNSKETDYQYYQKIDQKLKTCLLMIENDLLDKYGFNAVIVRPKNILTEAFVKIEKDNDYFQNAYRSYIEYDSSKVGVLKLNLGKLWEDKYRDKSFSQFKKQFYEDLLIPNFKAKILLKIEITLKDDFDFVLKKVTSLFDVINSFFSKKVAECTYFPEDQLYDYLKEACKIKDSQEHIIQLVIDLYLSHNVLNRRTNSNEIVTYLVRAGYEIVSSNYIRRFRESFNREQVSIVDYVDSSSDVIKLAKFASMIDVADYHIVGGEGSAIFIRINEPYKLRELARSDFYENTLLKKMNDQFELSLKIFDYFFTTQMSDNERWDFIEDYFLGKPITELLNKNILL